MARSRKAPLVVTHRIPHIEVYHVTDDELSRIEESHGQVGLDFTFAVSSLTTCISFGIAIATAKFSDKQLAVFVGLVVISGIIALYTGIKWWRSKNKVPSVISSIRSRKVDPETDE